MQDKGIDIACFKLGGVHVFPVTCPRIAKEILKKQDATFASRPTSMASGTFSGGYKATVLTPYGENWKKMRRVLTSEVVSPARHLWLHDKRAEEADNLVRFLHHKSKNGGVVDVRMASRHYAGNIVRRILFNKRYFESQRKDGGPTFMEEEHVNAIFTAVKYVYAFCVSDYLPTMLGLDLDGHEKIVKEALNTILKYHQPIIDERIDKWRNPDAHGSTLTEIQDLLDVLISVRDRNGKPLLSRQEITAQITVCKTEIAMAAVDNPSSAAEWTMAEMINNPCIMNKALIELDRVVGKNRLVQEQDIPNLNYIKSCVRESFRLHPVAPFLVPHVSLHDTVVEGYPIPKGSHVLISRMGLGRSPKIWHNPLEYNPERHYDATNCSNNISLGDPELRFISFSIGRRGCIATTLGTTMTIMLVARMLQGFSWKPPPNVSEINLQECENDLFLRQPLLASLTPRLPLHLYP